MSGEEITQNEIFQLLSCFSEDDDTNTPAKPPPHFTADEQLTLLKENICRFGIIRTAEDWKEYPDAYLGNALRMASIGLEREQVGELLGAAALTGEREKLKSRLQFNKRIMDELYCYPSEKEK